MSHTLEKVEYLINYSNRSKSPGWEKTRGETSSQDSYNSTIQLLEGYILFSGRHVPRSWLSVMYQAASWCLRSPRVHPQSSLLVPSCSTPQPQCCTGSCVPAQRFVVPSTAIRQANSDLTQGDRQKSMESYSKTPIFLLMKSGVFLWPLHILQDSCATKYVAAFPSSIMWVLSSHLFSSVPKVSTQFHSQDI